VIFDRSWYNRAGVDYVMGFCTEEEHRRFLEVCPRAEQWIVESGIILIKTWLEVGMDEQERRFKARISDPLRQWKLSPMDLESYGRWYDYSRARDLMLEATDRAPAPWHILRSDDKKRARLNGIANILSLIPYERIERDEAKLPKRSEKRKYDDQATMATRRFVPEVY
jgi:polyphosphate kinase 2 (PPK2 family)